MLLVGCGAAGAVAGIFKAPIAGLVFTIEVIMIDLTMSSLLPLLIASVTAATVAYLTSGQNAMFEFHLDEAFELNRIPYVILLGIFCGLVSLYFTRAMNATENLFAKLKKSWRKLIVGGYFKSNTLKVGKYLLSNSEGESNGLLLKYTSSCALIGASVLENPKLFI